VILVDSNIPMYLVGSPHPHKSDAQRLLEQLVNERLQEIMIGSFRDVVSYAEKHKVDNRTAAYMLALDRVAFAIKLRGIYA